MSKILSIIYEHQFRKACGRISHLLYDNFWLQDFHSNQLILLDTDHKEWLLFNKIWSTDFESIDVLKSKSLEGPWTLLSKNIAPKIIAEGPTSVKIGKYYHVYFDKYKENHMGLSRSTDLIQWEDMSSHIKFPPHAKHGTVFKVTPDIVKLISSAGL